MNIANAFASIGAAWRLFLRDPKALEGMDVSTEGFFRSFGALLLIFPLNILSDGGYGIGEIFFSTFVLGIEWLLFPLFAYLLLRLLGLTERFVHYVVAHNWGRVIMELFNLPAIVLFASGVVSASVALDLLLVSLGFSLYYRAQIALDTGWGLAVGIALLEVLLTIVFAVGVSQTSSLWLRG
jgi:uncharacterized membrane protein YqaE (UPF0057 family)